MAFQDIGLRIVLQGVGQFNRDVASAERSLNSLGTSLNSASQKSFSVTDSLSSLASGMTRLGMSMTAFISIPLAGLVTGLVKAGISFEDAFAGISKTVDGVSDSFGNLTPVGEELRENLRKLALEIPISANELARIGEIAGQLGIPLGEGGKDLLAYTEIIAKVGVSTDLSTEAAATGFARLANIIGVESENLIGWTEQTADAIVELGNNYATTEPEILNMALRFAGVASAAGITTDQILGLAAAVSSVGVQAELGGTTISRIFLNMKDAAAAAGGATEQVASKQSLLTARLKEFEKAVKSGIGLEELKYQFDDLDLDYLRQDLRAVEEGTKSLGDVIDDIRFRTLAGFNESLDDGQSKLTSYARITGLTKEAFAALVKSSPNEAFKLVIKSLGELDKQGKLTQDTMTELGFGNIRANEVIAKLAPNLDLLTEAQASSTRAMAENLALQEEAQKRFATTASKIQLMKNAIFDLGITVFDRLKPALDGALTSLTKLITAFSNALKSNNVFYRTIAKITAVLIAIGPVFLAVGTAIKFLVSAITAAKAGFAILGAAVGGISLPVALVIAAVAALALAFATDFMGIRTTVVNAITPVVKTLKYVAYWIGKAYEAGSKEGGGFLGGLVEAFNALFYVFTDERTTFFSKFFESFGVGKKRAEDLGLAIVNFKNEAANAFNQLIKAVSPFFKHLAVWTELTVRVLKRGDFEQALQNIKWMFEILGQDIENLITEYAPKIAAKLLEWGNAFINWVIPLIDQIIVELSVYGEQVYAWITEQAPIIVEKLSEWINAFKDWIVPLTEQIVETLTPYIETIFNWIVEQVPVIIDKLKEWYNAFIAWITPLVEQIEEKIGPVIDKIFEWIKKQVPEIDDKLLEWFNSFVNWIAPIAEKVVENLGPIAEGMFNWIKEQVPKIGEKLLEWGQAYYEWVKPHTDKLLDELLVLSESLTNWIVDQLPKITEKLAEWGAAFVNWALKVWLGEDGSGGLLSKLVELIGYAIGWIIGQGIELLATLIKEWVPAFIDWVGSIFEGGGEGAPSGGLKQKLLDFMGVVVDFITNDLFNMMVDAAKSLANGIINGIADGLGENAEWLKEQVKTFVQTNVIDSAKSLLGIKSPSTVFDAIGQNVGQGLANGIESKRGTIVSTISSIAATVSSIVSGIISAVQSAINAINAARQAQADYTGPSNLGSALNRGSTSLTGQTVYSPTNNYVRNYTATVNNPVGSTSTSSIKSSFRAASVAYG